MKIAFKGAIADSARTCAFGIDSGSRMLAPDSSKPPGHRNSLKRAQAVLEQAGLREKKGKYPLVTVIQAKRLFSLAAVNIADTQVVSLALSGIQRSGMPLRTIRQKLKELRVHAEKNVSDGTARGQIILIIEKAQSCAEKKSGAMKSIADFSKGAFSEGKFIAIKRIISSNQHDRDIIIKGLLAQAKLVYYSDYSHSDFFRKQYDWVHKTLGKHILDKDVVGNCLVLYYNTIDKASMNLPTVFKHLGDLKKYAEDMHAAKEIPDAIFALDCRIGMDRMD
jgi:hypothetical protein